MELLKFISIKFNLSQLIVCIRENKIIKVEHIFSLRKYSFTLGEVKKTTQKINKIFFLLVSKDIATLFSSFILDIL